MTQTTSVETIGNRLCTVIRKPFDPEWVREQLDMQQSVLACKDDEAKDCYTLWDCLGRYFVSAGGGEHAEEEFKWVVVILPALPRNPTRDDARLLHLYEAHGLHPFALAINKRGQPLGSWCGMGVIEAAEANRPMRITHGLINGQKCDIAIIDNEGE